MSTSSETTAEPARDWPRWVRFLSLAVAGAPYAVLFAYPYAAGRALSRVDHSVLPVVLLAAAGAFAFGFGFRCRSRWLVLASSPPVTWPVILGGAVAMWWF